MVTDYAELWVKLLGEAIKELPLERFKLWLYSVGIEGTYEERYKAGRKILRLMVPEKYNSVCLSYTSIQNVGSNLP